MKAAWMVRRLVIAAALGGIAACARQVTTGSPASPRPAATPLPPPQPWQVVRREHVDLWLHGFAMITGDTAKIPFFQRGYRQRMLALRRQQSAYTALDANQERLSARFVANPALTNGQFLAMYFPSLPALLEAVDRFIQAQGNPRAASDAQGQAEIALFAGTFRTAADREWVRLFVQSLQDESNRFYHAYWMGEQQRRIPVVNAVENRWTGELFVKFRRFLNNTQQAQGELLLSLPLGGEGRTIADGKASNLVAVTFPDSASQAAAAFYVFAHEVVGRIAEAAINDNTTPAEQRSGVASRYVSDAPVRAGAILLEHIAPELADGYMRFYLATAGVRVTGAVPALFASTFPLPDVVRDAIGRQIEVVLGGI